MSFLSSRISVSAAILIGIAFFLPWITVSCSGVSETASGFDLATGVSVDEASAVGGESESWPYLWVVPLGALVTLYAAYQRSSSGDSVAARATTKLIYYVAGGASLLAHVVFYFDLRSDISEAEEMSAGMIQVSYESGWWLSLLASIAIIAVAAYLVDRDPDPSGVSARSPGVGGGTGV